jgi:hypothetical protein
MLQLSEIDLKNRSIGAGIVQNLEIGLKSRSIPPYYPHVHLKSPPQLKLREIIWLDSKRGIHYDLNMKTLSR